MVSRQCEPFHANSNRISKQTFYYIRACKWFLTSMNSGMQIQRFSLNIPFIAVWTSERLITGVNSSLMYQHILLSWERLVAFITCEWFSPAWICVCSFSALLVENILPHSSHANVFSPMWILATCLFRECRRGNVLLHSEHAYGLYGFSLVWIVACRFKLVFRRNFVSHSAHANGFSPEWIIPCTVKSLFRANVLSHSEHTNGFSSVWICMCKRSLFSDENLPLHSEHTYDFKPVWIAATCSFKLLFRENVLWQSGHPNDFSIRWLPACRVKPLFCENVLSHTGHANGFSPVWISQCELKPDFFENRL